MCLRLCQALFSGLLLHLCGVGLDAVVDNLYLVFLHTVADHKVLAVVAHGNYFMIMLCHNLIGYLPKEVCLKCEMAGIYHLCAAIILLRKYCYVIFSRILSVNYIYVVFTAEICQSLAAFLSNG